LIASAAVIPFVSSGDSQEDLLPDKSYLRDYFEIGNFCKVLSNLEKEYFPGYIYHASVVFQTFDYSDEANQDAMIQIKNQVEKSGAVRAPLDPLWVEDYFDWLSNSSHKGSLTAKGRPPTESDFYLWLYEFLATPEKGFKHFQNVILQYGR